MAGTRRLELMAWARERGGLIVEDDYDAEFRYDRDPVGTLQGLTPDCVVSMGTMSKTLAPALRIGWIVAPEHIIARVAAAKDLADRGSSGIDQRALALLMESGRYDRHLRRMRAEYSARRRTLLDALATHAPTLEVTGLAAGFHAVLNLPAGADEQRIVGQARQRGVGVYGLGRMRRAPGPPALVLGFGDTPRHRIEPGIAAVADLLTGQETGPAR
jgi:GntR family transcriptional regulator/MocR family aminotransferase